MLVDYEILDAVRCQNILVNPFNPEYVNPGSLDISLGKTFGRVIPTGKLILTVVTEAGMGPRIVERSKPGKMRKGETLPTINLTPDKAVIDMTDKESFTTETFEAEEYILAPGEFILASMYESITLDDTIHAILKGKSSVGRIGITVGQSSGVIDAGWSGVLSMSIVNDSLNSVVLRYKQKIGQLIFTKTASCLKPYSITGRYGGANSVAGSQGV